MKDVAAEEAWRTQVHTDVTVFCSYCGEPPLPAGPRPSRICARCEMGLMLQAGAELAPRAGDAFIVVDDRLLIRAFSRGAEKLLGCSEPAAIHRPITQLLTAAAGASKESTLLELLVAAASGSRVLADVSVASPGNKRTALPARVGSCGPPVAALIVIGAREVEPVTTRHEDE